MRGRCKLRLGVLLLIGLWAGAGSGRVYSQDTGGATYTLMLRGVPMNRALEQLVRVTQIDLVYTSDLVADKQVYCTGRDVSAEALLRCVLTGSGLDYVRSSAGTFVLIEARQQPPRYGHLAGRIVDQSTGEPLPYANVLLADASAGTTTDEAGLFSFASLLTGPHRVMTTYVGYETAIDSVWIEAGGQRRLQIALRPRAVAMEPVVIDGLAQRLPSRALGSGILDNRQLAAFYAAGTPDVARGASSLPGVAAQQPLADLHIQGSAASEHLTLLDGAPVRDPVSLGRHLSAFSPLAIKRLTVHKAGFGAAHGSHLTGVVAVEHDVAGTEPRHVTVSADPVSFNGKAQGRFVLPGLRHGAAMVALRTSLWDVYRDPGIKTLLQHWNAVDPMFASIWIGEPVNNTSLLLHRQQPEIAFSDAHAAARLQLSPFRTLYASAYRARNRIATELLALNRDRPNDPDRVMLTRDRYDWTNWAGQVRHDWLIGARSVGMVQVLGSWHDSRYTYQALHAPAKQMTTPEEAQQMAAALRADLDTAPGSDEQNTIRELTLKAELSHSLTPRRHIDVALAATHTAGRFQLRSPFAMPFQHDVTGWDVVGSVEGELALSLQTTLEPGLRLTYLPLRQTLYAEPRLAVRYDRTASPVGPYALRLAGGLYRQFTNQFELSSAGTTSVVPFVLFWLPTDRSLAPPWAYHVAVDALVMPGATWTVDAMGYYKWQPRLLTIDYAAFAQQQGSAQPSAELEAVQQAAFIHPTRGRAYGGSVRLKRSGERFAGSLTYGVSRALRRYPGRFEEALAPVPWNETHRVSFDASAALPAGFRAEVNWRGAWGRRWGLRRAYYDYLALRTPDAFAPFDMDRPAAQALPPYYQLDVGVTFEHAWDRLVLQARVFLVNVLDRPNIYDWSLEQADAQLATVPRTLPGRHPVFTLRLDY